MHETITDQGDIDLRNSESSIQQELDFYNRVREYFMALSHLEDQDQRGELELDAVEFVLEEVNSKGYDILPVFKTLLNLSIETWNQLRSNIKGDQYSESSYLDILDKIDQKYLPLISLFYLKYSGEYLQDIEMRLRLKIGIETASQIYQGCKEAGRLYDVVNNLTEFLEADPSLAPTIYQDFKRSNIINLGIATTLQPYLHERQGAEGEYILEDMLILNAIKAKAPNLRNYLEKFIRLSNHTQSSDRKIINPRSPLGKFLKTELLDMSPATYSQLFVPLMPGLDNLDEKEPNSQASRIQVLLASLGGLDAIKGKSRLTKQCNAIIETARSALLKSISGIPLGEAERMVLEIEYGMDTIANALRLRRGQWALSISNEELRRLLLANETEASQIFHREVAKTKANRADTTIPEDAGLEISSLVASLLQAININKQGLNSPNILAVELDDLRQEILTSDIWINDQVAQDISNINIDTSDKLQQLNSIVLIGELSCYANQEQMQKLRALLLATYIHTEHIPEGIRSIIDSIKDDNQSLTLGIDQTIALVDFLRHNILQEFWGIGVAGENKWINEDVLKFPRYDKWYQEYLNNKGSIVGTEEIGFIQNSSLFMRTVAGAIGDACYSSSGNIVPESAQVVTMVETKTNKVLGNFLLLDTATTTEEGIRIPLKVLRAVNPLVSTLSRYDVDSIVETIISVSKDALPEGYQLGVIIDPKSNLATTNREAVLRVFKDMILEGKVAIEPCRITGKSVVFNKYQSDDRVHIVS
ncbi:hypothetical protein KA531_01560 [Candidatus Saccharibacteria bacterium]|nr:hypothetical protein [Candidatus Saccharibacteria bacterium]